MVDFAKARHQPLEHQQLGAKRGDAEPIVESGQRTYRYGLFQRLHRYALLLRIYRYTLLQRLYRYALSHWALVSWIGATSADLAGRLTMNGTACVTSACGSWVALVYKRHPGPFSEFIAIMSANLQRIDRYALIQPHPPPATLLPHTCRPAKLQNL